MQWFFSAINIFWRWWSKDYISVKAASVYILLLSAVFYLLGGYRPQSAYHHLEIKLADAQQEMRLFANEIARRNGQMNNLRARDTLNKKTIDLLGDKIETLENENTHWQEQNAFYLHVLENKAPAGGEVIIHTLEASPDFSRQEWKLSAILSRPGKRKKFNGGYYFEIVRAAENGEHLLIRAPEEGARDFEMHLYYEIEETINLPPNDTIEDLRVVIVDKKGVQIASVETGSLNNGGNNANNNGSDEPQPETL